MTNRPSERVLICADWFDPGNRAGGPIRSCANLVAMLGGTARLSVLTSDRDLGAECAYPDIPSNRWVNWRSKAAVCYASSPFRRMTQFVSILRTSAPKTVYLNSIFSLPGTLWPLLWVWSTRSPVRIVLAPRGMLKAAALNQKSWKKRPLIKLLHLLGVMQKVMFHATSEDEIAEIRAAFGDVRIRQISNVPCVPVKSLVERQKQTGAAVLTFVGRVHPTKNLLWLIQAMRTVTAECRLIVIGPIQDQAYYQQCRDRIKQLPSTVTVDFVGVKPEQEVRGLVTDSDAMILPTLGENFGHAIFEAFASGTPVITSDRTIWRNLVEQQAGWDLSLDQPEAFATAIGDIAAMNQTVHHAWRQGALDVAHRFLQHKELILEYQSLFFEDLNVEVE